MRYVIKGKKDGRIVYYSTKHRLTTNIHEAMVYGPGEFSRTAKHLMDNQCGVSVKQEIKIIEINE